jgi:glycine/D-amino acid oxidase-like deaminating enzyme
LLLASGHYRNGVLLAPASAEWVVQQIEAPCQQRNWDISLNQSDLTD